MALSTSPDVVLIDIQLPDIDGCDVARELLEKGCTSILIARSADSSPEIRQRCAANGFAEFKSKPIAMTDLIDTVRKWKNLRPN